MNGSEYADNEMEYVKRRFGEKLNEEDLKLFRFIIMEAYNEGVRKHIIQEFQENRSK